MLTFTPCHPDLLPGVRSITINGYHVGATIDGQPVDLRTLGPKWCDEHHMKVVNALLALEQSFRPLLDEFRIEQFNAKHRED